MAERTLQEIARHALDFARKSGAREVAASARRGLDTTVDWRDGKLEKVSQAVSRGLDLELYVDGRYSAVSTSDLRPDAVERFVAQSLALARALAPDRFRALPDPERYRGRSEADLQLDDPAHGSLTVDGRRDVARAVEAAAREAPDSGAILSVTASVSDSATETYRVHSNGFEGTRRATSFSVSASTSVRDADGRRPEDWASGWARMRKDLPDPAGVGREASRRALARRGSQKGASSLITVVVENRVGARLAGHLFGPLQARALQQKMSAFEGRIGEAVGGPTLDVRDDPHVPRGPGSQHWDGEGMATKPFAIFEAGVLRNYYVDNYYGRKLGLAPTTRGVTNLVWKAGDRGLDALVGQVKEGLLVTDFLGGNSNGTTGDFSLGVSGFRIREGARAEPVSEMNLSGNHLSFWKRLAAVGDDPYLPSTLRTPTLVFEGVQIAGR